MNNYFISFSEIGFGHLIRTLFLFDNIKNKVFFTNKYYQFLKEYKRIKINLTEKLGYNLYYEINKKTILMNVLDYLKKSIKQKNLGKDCIFFNDSSIIVGEYLRKLLNCSKNILLTNHFDLIYNYYILPKEKREKYRHQYLFLKKEFEKLKNYYKIIYFSIFHHKNLTKIKPPFPRYYSKKEIDFLIYLPPIYRKIFYKRYKNYKIITIEKFIDRFEFLKLISKSKVIISLAGYNTIIQSIINYSIPYVIPIKNHIEQEFNFYWIKKYINDNPINLLKDYEYYLDILNLLNEKLYKNTNKKWLD